MGRLALVCLGLVVQTGLARAQAWTSPARTLELDANYQLGYATQTENSDVHVIHHYFIPSVEYSITDQLQVSASLPLIAIECPNCQTLDGGSHAHGAYDDGSYHFTPTDARVTARYMIPLGPIAITPQIGGSAPVRLYEWAGNASAGRRLNAAYAGVNVGVNLESILPRTLINVMYELAIVEKFNGAGPEGSAINQDYSTFSAQIIHTIRRVHIHLGVDGHYNHDGISFSQFPQLPEIEQLNHDPILREHILLAGGGVSYDLGDRTTLYAAVRIFVTGENTSNASLFSVGATWDFDL